MSTRTSSFRPQMRLDRWGDGAETYRPLRPAAHAAQRSPGALFVVAPAALAVAVLVAWLVDTQVNGQFAMAFRTLWWLMLAFNVVDAVVQRTRVDAWNTLLLKYVMVGVTYSMLV